MKTRKTLALSVVMAALVSMAGFAYQIQPFSLPTGVLYADSFGGNAPKEDWQLSLSSATAIPSLKNGGLCFSGTAGIPSAAMLMQELPQRFDISFTADIARRGGNTRSPTVMLNVGGTLGERYHLWMDEGSIKLTHGTNTTLMTVPANITGGQAYAFRLAVDGNTLTVYFDGHPTPIMTYTGTGPYASLQNARYFGVYCYCYEFYLDNLLITDGQSHTQATALQISGPEGQNVISGLNSEFLMTADVTPSTVTDSALVWSVSDKSMAAITQDGVLTPKKTGMVTVTAKTRDGSQLTQSCTLTILSDGGGTQDNGCLADDYISVFESTSPQDTYVYSPALCILPSGRIIATCDLGGEGVSNYTPVGYSTPQPWGSIGRAAYSDDNGETWQYPFDGPFMFGQPFHSGGEVYIVGRNGEGSDANLVIFKSTDEGETWSAKTVLDTRRWHSSPTEALYKNGYIYMTMEVSSPAALAQGEGGVACLAPILMRAREGTNLLDRNNWTFSGELAFSDLIPEVFADGALDYFGVPYQRHSTDNSYGWLEGNVFQIYDKRHEWYDPAMKTFYIYLRGGTLRPGYAAVMKVVEQNDGSMVPSAVKAPSGTNLIFVPMPGGNNKFGMTYDKETKTYWLVSSYNYDSMAKRNYISGDRATDPANQRNLLALHFSKNAMDWSFAGLVSAGEEEYQARSYAYLTISGDDLLVLSRSGDERACSAHDTNLATLHRIENFRDLNFLQGLTDEPIEETWRAVDGYTAAKGSVSEAGDTITLNGFGFGTYNRSVTVKEGTEISFQIRPRTLTTTRQHFAVAFLETQGSFFGNTTRDKGSGFAVQLRGDASYTAGCGVYYSPVRNGVYEKNATLGTTDGRITALSGSMTNTVYHFTVRRKTKTVGSVTYAWEIEVYASQNPTAISVVRLTDAEVPVNWYKNGMYITAGARTGTMEEYEIQNFRATVPKGEHYIGNDLQKFTVVRGLSGAQGAVDTSYGQAVFTGYGGSFYQDGTGSAAVKFTINDHPSSGYWFSFGLVNQPNTFWRPDGTESQGLVTTITVSGQSVIVSVKNVTTSGTVDLGLLAASGKDNIHMLSFHKQNGKWYVTLNGGSNYLAVDANTVALGSTGYLAAGANGSADMKMTVNGVYLDEKMTANMFPSVADEAIGDINGDGVVSGKDIVAMKRNMLGLTALNFLQNKTADIDGDGMVTVVDAVILKKQMVAL